MYHLFKRHILSVLASLGGKIYNSLSIFSPCKNAVLISMEFRRHFFCAPINSTTRKVSFEQVGKSFKISSFDGSSKPSFRYLLTVTFFHGTNPFNMH